MRSVVIVLALACALVAGCPGPAAIDAAIDDAGPLSLTLGTGAHEFTAIAPGQTLLLARGCQGLQHVWIALRATGIAPRGVRVRLSLVRPSDGAVISAAFDTAITFTPDAGGAFVELDGLTLVVPAPDEGLGMPLLVRAELTDRQGRTIADEENVNLAWGTEICGM